MEGLNQQVSPSDLGSWAVWAAGVSGTARLVVLAHPCDTREKSLPAQGDPSLYLGDLSLYLWCLDCSGRRLAKGWGPQPPSVKLVGDPQAPSGQLVLIGQDPGVCLSC